jgi:hypothetical protein
VFRKQYHVFFLSFRSYLGRDQRMTPPESPREVREVREAGLLQTLDQNREQGQCPPEMEFLDIIMTRDSSLCSMLFTVPSTGGFYRKPWSIFSVDGTTFTAT